MGPSLQSSVLTGLVDVAVEVTSEYAARFYDMYVEGHTGKHLTGDRIRILLLNLPFLFRDLIAPEVMFPSTFRQSCLCLV